MGFWSGVGKAGLGLANGVGASAIGMSKVAGHMPAKNMMKAPGMFAASLGVGAASGMLMADAFGEDPKEGAKQMGVAAFAGASLGAAGAITKTGAIAAGAAIGGAGVIADFGTKMVKPRIDKVTKKAVDPKMFSDFKLSGKGKMLFGAGIALTSASKAFNTYEKSRMGTNDGMMRTATPMIPQPMDQGKGQPSYANNAGATGDLVFSMFNNR